MTKITYNVQHHNAASAANLMDDEIREKLHADRDWTSEQEFFDAYVEAHAQKYGEDFAIN